MQVTKRNGKTEMFNFEKIAKVIRFACNEEQAQEFLDDLQLQIHSSMTTQDIQNSLIRLAVDKVSLQTPEWDKVAEKLYLYGLVKEANLNRGHKKYGYFGFYQFIKQATKDGLYDPRILKNYCKSEIEELEEYIKPERDYDLSFVGLRSLSEKYLVKGFEGEALERPQEAFMGVAMTIALAEEKENRVHWTKNFYDVMSTLSMTEATPTMMGARKTSSQYSSCFIGTMDDSLESIYNTVTNFSTVSKAAGGMGIYMGKIRATNSDIRGFKGKSGGVIPWGKIINDTCIAVDQLGSRKGAVSVTLDAWHKDIIDFLGARLNTGDERRKLHDIFPAVSIPDIFMRKLKDKEEWNLFCPHEIKTLMGYRLEDCYDDGKENLFSKRYEECVAHPLLSRTTVSTIDILKMIIKSAKETGTPFLFFRDNVNRMNPSSHNGMIYSSNLCHEICQNMSPNGELVEKVIEDKDGNKHLVQSREIGDFVTCNLASINLAHTNTKEKLADVVPVAIRMIDNVITINDLPVKEAQETNKKYRALGLGVFGLHDLLALNHVKWESEESLQFQDDFFEEINYLAVKTSLELAIEKGAAPASKGSEWETGDYFDKRGYNSERWDELRNMARENGIRNLYIMAVAPTGTSSLYGNGSASIDPIYKLFYIEEKKNAINPVVVRYPEKMWFYKESHKIDQTWSIRANAIRQRHIDQSQSFNLYVTPETGAGKIAKMYMMAWELGVKTIYYTRSLGNEVEDCESCSV